MGHRMMIAGLYPKQYVWCELCGAYTGNRAQKLTKHCKGSSRHNSAIKRPPLGCNPDGGTMLATPPRRMSRRDVGGDTILDSCDLSLTVYGEASCSELPCVPQSVDCAVDLASGYRNPSSIHEIVVEHPCDEEDPLDLGFALG